MPLFRTTFSRKTLLNLKKLPIHRRINNHKLYCTKKRNDNKILSGAKLRHNFYLVKFISDFKDRINNSRYKSTIFDDKNNIIEKSQSKIQDNNQIKNNIKRENVLSMAIIQLPESGQKLIVIPITDNSTIGQWKNLQSLPKNILNVIQTIYTKFEKNDTSTLIPFSSNLVSKIRLDQDENIQKHKGEENIEDVKIDSAYGNISKDEVFHFDVSDNVQKMFGDIPYTGITMEIDVDMTEAKNAFEKFKKKNYNFPIPINANIKGMYNLDTEHLKEINVEVQPEDISNMLSIAANITTHTSLQSLEKYKKIPLFKHQKRKISFKTGKLMNCKKYAKAIKEAEKNRKNCKTCTKKKSKTRKSTSGTKNKSSKSSCKPKKKQSKSSCKPKKKESKSSCKPKKKESKPKQMKFKSYCKPEEKNSKSSCKPKKKESKSSCKPKKKKSKSSCKPKKKVSKSSCKPKKKQSKSSCKPKKKESKSSCKPKKKESKSSCKPKQKKSKSSCKPKKKESKSSCKPKKKQSKSSCKPKKKGSKSSSKPKGTKAKSSCQLKKKQSKSSCKPKTKVSKTSCKPKKKQSKSSCKPKKKQSKSSCKPKKKESKSSCKPKKKQSKSSKSSCKPKKKQSKSSCKPKKKGSKSSSKPKGTKAKSSCQLKKKQSKSSCKPKTKVSKSSCKPKKTQSKSSCKPKKKGSKSSSKPKGTKAKSSCQLKKKQSKSSCKPKTKVSKSSCKPKKKQSKSSCKPKKKQSKSSCKPKKKGSKSSSKPKGTKAKSSCQLNKKQSKSSCKPKKKKSKSSCKPKKKGSKSSSKPKGTKAKSSCQLNKKQSKSSCKPKKKKSKSSCKPKKKQSKSSCKPKKKQSKSSCKPKKKGSKSSSKPKGTKAKSSCQLNKKQSKSSCKPKKKKSKSSCKPKKKQSKSSCKPKKKESKSSCKPKKKSSKSSCKPSTKNSSRKMSTLSIHHKGGDGDILMGPSLEISTKSNCSVSRQSDGVTLLKSNWQTFVPTRNCSSTVNKIIKINDRRSCCYQLSEIEPLKDLDVLVKVSSVALSDSDVHMYETCSNSRPSITLGHEATGIIEKVGKHVNNLRIGDAVVLESAISCGLCQYCKSGLYNICPNIYFNGALSTYCTHPAHNCYKMPSDLSLEDGTLTDLVAMSYQCCKLCKLGSGNSLVIFGDAPLCLGIYMCAITSGCRNILLVCSSQKYYNFATKLNYGPAILINPNEDNKEICSKIYSILNSLPDTAINCSGSTKTMNSIIGVLRPGGTCILAGCIKECATFNIFEMLTKNIVIKTCLRSHNMFPAAVELMSHHSVDAGQLITHRYPLKHIQRAFEKALLCGDDNEVIKILVKISDF